MYQERFEIGKAEANDPMKAVDLVRQLIIENHPDEFTQIQVQIVSETDTCWILDAVGTKSHLLVRSDENDGLINKDTEFYQPEEDEETCPHCGR